jgi:DNA repair exonuclease SbcCD nuclease subunit
MKIAVTADLHLNSKNGERFANLEGIINILINEDISTMVLAGDTLDKDYDGYSDLDTLAEKYTKFNFLIIPGNHDIQISNHKFSAQNIEVMEESVMRNFDGLDILFLPYKESAFAGKLLNNYWTGKNRAQKWVLVSHCDFERKQVDLNGGEIGYFPLTRSDISIFEPNLVLLGHLHKPMEIENGRVVYAGSPYPVRNSETGQRRVLVLDTETLKASSLYLVAPPVYIDMEFFIIPDDNEAAQVEAQFNKQWSDFEREYVGDIIPSNVYIKLRIWGFCSSREGVAKTVSGVIEKKGANLVESPDIEGLKIQADKDLAVIAGNITRKIEELNLNYDNADELKKLALRKALEIVYSEK